MKKVFLLFAATLAVVLINGCKDKCYTIEKQLVVVADYMDANTVMNSFAVEAPKTLVKPGNIYKYKNYLLVCEQEKGIHIMNNSNPASPVSLKYIKLLGNDNVAVKNDYLYADNGTNLLTINIADLNNIQLVNTNTNVFPERMKDGQVIVGYHTEEKTVKLPCDNTRQNIVIDRAQQSMQSPAEATGVTGKGGSMARFAVVNDYLYIAKHDKLTPFEVKNPAKPVKKLSIGYVNNDVETLFPYGDHLFFGASSGVYVYNFKSNPETPRYVSTMRHIEGCDPVVVQDNFAFSTVRNGSVCRSNNGLNRLFVFDISTITSPRNVLSQEQESPFGLGIKDNLLFVCNGTKGLFVYDWNPGTRRVSFRNSYPDIHAFDVIVDNNTLIVTADNGLFQFDFSDPNNIKYLSTLVEFK